MNLASLYQCSNSVQRHDAKKIMGQFEKILQWRRDCNDAALIDIGSGTGDVLKDFIYPVVPENYKLIMGTDISPAMLEFALNRYESNERIQFQLLDIGCELLPMNLRGAFDHVTSFYCLHWLRDQKKALQNIYHLLRPTSGDCILVILVSHVIYDVYKVLIQQKKWRNYLHDYEKYVSPLHNSEDPAREYRKLLQETGFDDCSVELRDEVYIYNGVQNYRDNMKAVIPLLERMPTDKQEEYLDEFLETVDRMNLRQNMDNGNDYKFITPYKLIVAYARKSGGRPDSGIINEEK